MVVTHIFSVCLIYFKVKGMQPCINMTFTVATLKVCFDHLHIITQSLRSPEFLSIYVHLYASFAPHVSLFIAKL